MESQAQKLETSRVLAALADWGFKCLSDEGTVAGAQ